MKRYLVLLFLLLLFVIPQHLLAQQQTKTTYYFIDAVNVEPERETEEERMYFYSYPIHKTDEKINEQAILNEFRQTVKSTYHIADLESCVLRVNDNYDQVKMLRELTIDKYKIKNYRIVRIDTPDK